MANENNNDVDLIRRRLLSVMISAPALTVIACTQAGNSLAQAVPLSPTTLMPTPVCDDGDDDPTPAQTEGPYFTSNSPERQSLLEATMPGTRRTMTGRVVTTACAPVARAKLDFWQADNAGAYDNSGYRLRGHQYTDEDGRFTLETIVPGLYPGRTRHIHVKAQAPNRGILTTQLYFPGESRNTSDGLFNRALLMDVQGQSATFQFVLNV